MQTRQLADGGFDGIGLGACCHAGIEAHKVVGMHAAQGLGGQLTILAYREQLLKRAYATCDDACIGQRQLAHRLGHERDNLDIARGIARTDKLKAQLCKLARAAGIALALTNHRRLVAKA